MDLGDAAEGDLDPEVVAGLIDMLDEHNPLVRQFRSARDHLVGYEIERLSIQILAPSDGDGPQYT